MTISFNSIPINILTPGSFIEFDSSRANSGLPRPRNRTVLIGQKTATGTVSNNTLTRVNTLDEAKAYFGRGSMLARMFEFYRKTDKTRAVYAVALNDAAGSAAATGTIVINSAATENGTIELKIGGNDINIGVLASDTAANIAANIAAAINAKLDLPVTASASTNTTTITAKNKGTLGNKITLLYNYNDGSRLPTGLGLTITPMANGATDPDITAAYTAIGDEAFKTHVIPYSDQTSITFVKNFLAAASAAMVQNDGYFVAANIASLNTNLTLGGLFNTEFGVILGLKGVPNMPYELAASLAGTIATSEDIDPALPFTGLQIAGITPPKEIDRHIRQERQYLLEAGISTAETDNDGNLIIERIVTLYKTNNQGLPDTSYQDLNALLTLFYIRWSVNYRIATKYPRHKLGDDSATYGAGQAVVTPNTIRAELWALFKEWEAAALVENFAQFKTDLVVERDPSDRNRINAQIPPDLINQFLVFTAQVQFRR